MFAKLFSFSNVHNKTRRKQTRLLTGLFGLLSLLGYHTATALGLGEIQVKSGLGQSLQATVAVYGREHSLDVRCIRAQINTVEGSLLMTAMVNLLPTTDGNDQITLTTVKTLSEPVVYVNVSIACGGESYRHEYAVLLDAPGQKTPVQSETVLPTSLVTVHDVGDSVATTAIAGLYSQPHQHMSVEAHRSHHHHSSTSQKSAKHAHPMQHAMLSIGQNGLNTDTGIHLQMSNQLLGALAMRAANNIRALQAAQQHLHQLEISAVPADQTVSLTQQQLLMLQHENRALKQQNLILQANVPVTTHAKWLIPLSMLALFELISLIVVSRSNRALRAQHALIVPQSTTEPIVPRTVTAPPIVIMPPEVAAPLFDTHLITPPSLSPDVDWSIELMNHHLDEPNVMQTIPSGEVEVEEISDITQEAEFWMSVNNPHKAIDVLEMHISSAENGAQDSPAPWLYLLDLYHMTHDRSHYDALRARFTTLFNVKTIDFDVNQTTLLLHTLEDYPRLTHKISQLWRSPDIIPYLRSLLLADPTHQRVGFDLPVYRDILLLISIAQILQHMMQATTPPAIQPMSTPQDDLDLNLMDFHEACKIIEDGI